MPAAKLGTRRQACFRDTELGIATEGGREESRNSGQGGVSRRVGTVSRKVLVCRACRCAFLITMYLGSPLRIMTVASGLGHNLDIAAERS